MHTEPVTTALLERSVIAVPPLARTDALAFAAEPNQAMVRHLEAGGIRTILYGGNANFYHVRPGEYPDILDALAGMAGEDTWVIPSAGPTYGMMMEQAAVLAARDFPTAMVLPMSGMTTSAGVARGIRDFVQAFDRPAVLYIKADGYIDLDDVAALDAEGCIACIKYATVREDPAVDAYLAELVKRVRPSKIVSGIGEQPVIEHCLGFGLTSFTSGCVSVAPARSMAMLRAVQAKDGESAVAIRERFRVLEDLRNAIHPVRVLHAAVSATVADMGPPLPLLSGLSASEAERVTAAAEQLLVWEQSGKGGS